MGDWNLLGSILEEVHVHSTIVGKIWLTILFIFRMLVLGVAAEDVWDDEQTDFVCNTEQPGCRNVCYDRAFPISLIRYWVLQVIFVSSPSLVYMGHALYRLRALEKERQRKRAHLRAELELEPILEEQRRIERQLRKLEEQKKLNKAPLRGSLLRTYVLHILTRSVFEVGFVAGQYALYGFKLDALYKCVRFPCPNSVDCYVSRPTEKTIFMIFMHSIAVVSLFLNILEFFHLGIRKIRQALYERPQSELTEDDISICKSKKNSMIQHVCVMGNSSPQKTIPLSPTSYCPPMDQGGLPAYLPPTQGFKVIQGTGEQGQYGNGLGHDRKLFSGDQNNSNQPQGQPHLHGKHEQGLGRRLHNPNERYHGQLREQSLPALQNRHLSSSSEDSHNKTQQTSLGSKSCLKSEQSLDQPKSNPAHPYKSCLHSSHVEISSALRKYSRVSSCKDLEESRRDSLDSALTGHAPRKTSFMSRVLSDGKLASDPESPDSRNGSGSEIKRREESPPGTPPPAPGRRLSMALSTYKAQIKQAKASFLEESLLAAENKSQTLFKIVKDLASPASTVKNIPASQTLCDALALAFEVKITTILNNLASSPDSTAHTSLDHSTSMAGPTINASFAQLNLFPLPSFEDFCPLAEGISSGSPLDPLPPKFWKLFQEELFPPLFSICCQSLELAQVPDCWKLAVVSPLLKKATLDPTCPANFRPISLLPFPIKILEKLVTKHLSSFMESSACLDVAQFGFRPAHGTESALVTVLDDLRTRTDQGRAVFLVLLDMSTAFNTVSHTILIRRLEEIGVSGLALNWLISYLDNRHQMVALPPFKSNIRKVGQGVPQGSAISPILFNLYLRPLIQLIKSYGIAVTNYADDTQLVFALEEYDSRTIFHNEKVSFSIRDETKE
ncbi:gap junction alpha-10 protein [Lissotriton helveticus]